MVRRANYFLVKAWWFNIMGRAGKLTVFGEQEVKHIIIVLVFAVLCVCGCGAKHPLLATRGEDVVRPQFADIPVPQMFKYLIDKSYRFEYDWKKVRHGRLFYRGHIPAAEVQDFYREKMLNANWEEVGLMSGEKTEIVFEKGSGDTRERCIVTVQMIGEKTIVEIKLDPVKK